MYFDIISDEIQTLRRFIRIENCSTRKEGDRHFLFVTEAGEKALETAEAEEKAKRKVSSTLHFYNRKKEELLPKMTTAGYSSTLFDDWK